MRLVFAALLCRTVLMWCLTVGTLPKNEPRNSTDDDMWGTGWVTDTADPFATIAFGTLECDVAVNGPDLVYFGQSLCQELGEHDVHM